MGFFDSMKVDLFSEMKGVVTMDNRPVVGAVITRTAVPNNDKKYSDSTTTDSQGSFQFGRMQTSMFLKLLPTSIVVQQKIDIEYEGKQYLAWETNNFDGRDRGELNEHEAYRHWSGNRHRSQL